MKHANAMSEPAMSRARINQLRKAQLTNAAKALEGTSLNHTPQNLFEFFILEFD